MSATLPVNPKNEAPWQAALDTYYHQHGPCCAGCDHWRSLSPSVGECQWSAIVSGAERMRAMGIDWSSHRFGEDRAITQFTHACDRFEDTFDWSSLPLPYRRKVGGLTLASRGRAALTDRGQGEGSDG